MIEHKLLTFVAHYGYIGLFAALMLGLIGLPVPDEILMTFAGYLISRGRLLFIPTVVVSTLGSLTGMSVSYVIGYKFGYPLMEKYGSKIHITKDKLERAERWFKRFGGFAVTIGYFIPGFRHLTAYFAGIRKWPFRTFVLYSAPGALIWCAAFITLGKGLGAHWRTVAHTTHRYLLFIIVIAIVLAGVLWFIKIARDKKLKANS